MNLVTQEFLSFPPKAFASSDGVSHLRIMKHDVANPLLPKIINIKILRTAISPVVLYGYKTWSLILSEEHKMKVFENSVLGKIFGRKTEKEKGWRKLHNKELHELYSSPNTTVVIKSRMTR